MANIWDYKDADIVIITAITGVDYKGRIISMLSSDDLEDIIENPEDSISIENNDGIFGFYSSEIKSITVA